MIKFYAVKEGRNKGIYKTWEECQKQVIGYKGAIYKSFTSYEEAESFILNKDTTEQKYKDVEHYAYIDGSYDKESKIYGSGIVIVNKQKITYHKIAGNNPELAELRNVTGEIEAVKYVLNYAQKNNIKEITIYYDYAGIENWPTKKWQTNLTYTKNYADLVQKISENIKINFVKVKAHSGIELNEQADKLAKESIKEFYNSEKNIFKNEYIFGDKETQKELEKIKDKKYEQESFFD